MKIAIIGFGNVGSALGRGWAAKGHQVTFGSRNPADPKAQAAAKAIGAGFASIAEAAAGADVVALTVPWGAVPEALASAGSLAGKVLLDATNPLTADLSGLSIGHTTSAGEEVARLAPGARVVKIFNTTGSANMERPDYGGTPVTMLYAGDDAAAKATAASLAKDLGFDAVDYGGLAGSRQLEAFALVWITLAYRGGLGPGFALNIVRRPA